MDTSKSYSIDKIYDAICAAFKEKSRIGISEYSGLRKNVLELDDWRIGPFANAVLQELTMEVKENE